MKNKFRFFASMACIFASTNLSLAQSPHTFAPGWIGDTLINCDSTGNWSVETNSTRSFGNIVGISGILGNALQLNWSSDTGGWVQSKYTFPRPVDLSQKDIFGLSLRGSTGKPYPVSVMFADTNGVFYGLDCNGVNSIPFWMKNLIFPKKQFRFFWGPSQTIDWTRITHFFVAPKNLDSSSGQLAIDHLQADSTSIGHDSSNLKTLIPMPLRQQSY